MHPSRMRRELASWGLAVVRGRSMQPTLHDGDRLLVRHGAAPRAGDLVVVRLPDGVVAVKRATARRDGGWWVERDNPAEGVDSWQVGAIPDDRRAGRGPAARVAAAPVPLSAAPAARGAGVHCVTPVSRTAPPETAGPPAWLPCLDVTDSGAH